MNIWTANRIMNRLDEMIEHATNGEEIEKGFDETKMSALETKLAKYLAMNHTGKRELEEEKLRVNQLISDISHQTKTPIANIMLYAQLLEEKSQGEKGVLTQEQSDCIKALTAQAAKLDFLIAELMKASRLETGIVTLMPKQQAVEQMLEQVMEQIMPVAQLKNIRIVLHTPQDSFVYAFYDMKWTTEAVFNILDNAVKYSPEGGEILVSLTMYQLFCRIDVKDHGIGIREEDTSKIFARFYRSEAVREKEGVGLGLYLAREIISKESGYIKVQSEPGKGSVFSVFLPMQ